MSKLWQSDSAGELSEEALWIEIAKIRNDLKQQLDIVKYKTTKKWEELAGIVGGWFSSTQDRVLIVNPRTYPKTDSLLNRYLEIDLSTKYEHRVQSLRDNCYATCKDIIGVGANRWLNKMNIAELSNYDGGDYITLKTSVNFDAGIKKLDELLEKGQAVIVGVHHEPPQNSANKYLKSANVGTGNPETYHFVVIIGRKKDLITKKIQYRFYDVGHGDGKLPNNIFELDTINKTLSGKATHPDMSWFYRVTLIRY